MKRPSRRANVALVAIAAVVIPVALGWFPQDPLRRWVERALVAALGPANRIGSLHAVPALLSVEAGDVRLAGDGWELELPRIRVALSPGLLLGGASEVRALELESPSLRVTAATAGAESAGGPSFRTLPVTVRSLSVDGGRVEYRSGDAAYLAEGIAAGGSVGVGALSLSARRLAWIGAETHELGSAEATLSIDVALRAAIRELTLRLGPNSELSASGSLGSLLSPSPDLTATARVDLADAVGARLLDRGSGVVEGRAHVEPSGGAIRYEAQLAGRALAAEGWPVERARLQLSGDAADARLEGDADLLGGRLEASGALRSGNLDARLLLEGIDAARVAAARGGIELPGGQLRGDLRLQGPVDAPLAVSGAVGFASGSALDLTGRVSGHAGTDGRADLTWRARAGVVAPVPGLALGPLAQADLEAEGAARGAPPPDVDARLHGSVVLAWGAERPLAAEVDGTARYAGGALGADVELRAAEGRLQLVLQDVAGPRPGGRAEGSGLRLEWLDPRLAGRADLQLDTTGPIERLAADGRLRVDALGWQELDGEGTAPLALGPADVALHAAEGRGRLHGELPDLGLVLDADAPLAGLDPVRLDAALVSLPLDRLASLFGRDDLSGTLSGRGEATVPLAAPLDADVQIALSGATILVGGRRIQLDAPLDARWRERRLALSGLSLSGEGARLSGEIELGLAESGRLAGEVELSADLARLPAPDGWPIQGRLDAHTALSGSRARPELRGTAALRGVSVGLPGGTPLVVPDAAIGLEGDAVSLPEVSLDIAGGSVTLAGRLPLAALLPGWRADPARLGEREEADLRIGWTRLDVPALLSVFRSETVETPALALTGRARLQGGLASLEEARLDLSMDAADADFEGLHVRIEPLELEVASATAELRPLVLQARGARFQLGGRMALRSGGLDLEARGELPLRTLNPLLESAALGGTGQVELKITGDRADPLLDGRVAIRDGTLRLRALPQALTDLSAELRLEGRRLTVTQGSGRLGGGTVALSGFAETQELGLGQTHLEIDGTEIALRYPPGLNSRLNADLALDGAGSAFRLHGTVTATRGLYDLDIALGASLLVAPEVSAPSPLLQAIALDIDVVTQSPVLVRNNLARLEAQGSLTARGDMDAPEPYGRLEILRGGKVFLRGREFNVASGSLVYSGDWNPRVSLSASTQIEDTETSVRHTVTVRAEGPLEQAQISFSSEPALGDPAILSLIASGTTRGRGLAEGASVAGEQLASFLTGRLTGNIERGLEELGLDEVSIEPQLLAREEDPTARFTFGKRLTPELKLVYSIGLGGAEERFLRAELEPWRNLTAAVQRSDAGLVSYSLGQRLRFGASGPPRPTGAATERVALESVALEGELPVPERELRAALRAAQGRRVTEWELQEDAERLRRHLVEQGFLEAQVGARLDDREAKFQVRAGPRYTWRVVGMTAPPDLGDAIREAFHEAEALDLGRARLLRELRDEGHLRAQVSASAEGNRDARELIFEAEPGPRLRVERLSFPGAEHLSPGQLEKAAGGVAALLTDSAAAREGIENAYREAHYLAARAGEPDVAEAAGRVSISVPVDEGPRARLAAARVVGEPEGAPSPALGLAVGETFDPEQLAAAERRLREHYLGLGYPAVRVRTRLETREPDLAAVFELSPGDRVVVGGIEVTGLRRTRRSLVLGRLTFSAGDPLDPRELVRSESRLLALGIFERAAVRAEGNPATVTVDVEERPRFTAGYDLRYNDDERLSALTELEAGNLLGSGLTVGTRVRVGRDVRELRGSLFRPALLLGGDLTLSLFQLEEDLDPGVEGLPDNLRRQRGVEIQQNLLLPDRWNLLYGYRFRRSTLFVGEPAVAFPQNVAALELSAFRDTRDDVLNPRRGRFYSLSLSLAPEQLGSSLPFLKGFAQASFVRRLTPELLWAHGYRLGLGTGLGGEPMPRFERFRAGGPNSLRGFDTEAVGPRDFLDEPTGGEAVAIVNQELRFRHAPTGLGAVVFYDGGNVFETVREFDLHWRHVLGVGLRYESPVGLLRFDWGFPLDPREGEPSYRLHFSLGQAF